MIHNTQVVRIEIRTFLTKKNDNLGAIWLFSDEEGIKRSYILAENDKKQPKLG